MKVYAFGSRTNLGLASFPSMVKKSMVWVHTQTTAAITTTAVLKKGEGVAAVYYLESAPQATGDIDPKSPLLNEFSGELMWELCDGKEC
jgi:hypothetical protein